MIPFERSFASYEKAKYWNKKNTMKPEDILKNSHTKCTFDCEKCKHEFVIRLDDAVKNGWCPYCSSKKICDNSGCISCYDKSFASHEKSKFWSNKNDKLPRNIFKNSHAEYTFDCEDCKHEFTTKLSSVTKGNTWCPYCTNQKLCEDSSCISCHGKSFASHEKSIYWSIKNKICARNVFKNAHKKYTFDCLECRHEFDSSPNCISDKILGVHIVLIKNYAKMKIVKPVLINHSLLTSNQISGVIKIVNYQEKYLEVLE